jgi:hypothetical protein
MWSVSRSRVVLGVVTAGCLAVTGVAAADPGQDADNGSAPLLHGTTHCTNGIPGTDSGVVVAHTNTLENDTRVHVTLLGGEPNQTYYVAIACQRYIGTLTTNSQGNGTANIDAPGVTVGTFYVDLGIGNGGPSTVDYRIAGPFIGG